jgi:radical SAM protein with 4Fe4S-binding SPASM domain
MSLLKYLTPVRALNILQIYSSFFLSRITGKASVWGQPIGLSIEPTTSCNLRCPECPSGLREFTRDTGMLKYSLFKRIIDQIHKRTFYLTLYFQGEPFLNKNVYEMIAYAKTKKMYVVTSTNAHYLTEENCRKIIASGLDRLIISVDGATQESYSKYRVGGDLAKVINGVKELVRLKKELRSEVPFVSIQTIIFSTNEHELENIKKLASDLEADELKFKSAQVYEYEEGNELIPSKEQLSRYVKGADGKYKLRGAIDDRCWKMWSSAVMTWDGIIVPCCFDKDATHRMGNINTHDLSEIWKSPPYVAFRKTVLTERSSVSICRNCSEGAEVFVHA